MTENRKNEQIDQNINHLGPFMVDKKWAYNSYLIPVSHYFVCIDITPLHVYDLFKTSIEKYASIQDIKYLVIQHFTLSTLHALIQFIEDGFSGVVITNAFYGKEIKQSGINCKLEFIEDIEYRLNIGEKDFLLFHPMIFLPYPHMFMTYSSVGLTFFSSMLCSSYFEDSLSKMDIIKKQAFQFHLENMPMSNYLKPLLDLIKSTKHKQICPIFGHLLKYDFKDSVIDYLYKHDFYNSNQYSAKYKTIDDVRIYELIQQVLVHLSKYYSKHDIVNIFLGSPYHLEHDSLMLKKSTLEGYKLYHGIFEHIYAKKGLLWLSIIEPIVNKFVETYQYELPTIYRSLVVQMNKEKEELEKRKNELESNFQKLTIHMNEIKESALRCPFTNLYYQSVLSELMKAKLETKREDSFGLLLIQLDQLVSINKRYGKETGNESIRNLSYLINDILKLDQQLFKQYGPGLFLFSHQINEKESKRLIQVIKNIVNDSQLFIEKVSVTISFVLESEIEKDIAIELQVNQLFDLLEKRMFLLKNSDFKDIKEEQNEKSILSEGKILLVDEDETNRNMIYRIFKRIHYEVVLASNVEQALKCLDMYKIDIIISEINLSKIDGFQLKQMLNENTSYQHIPFIMVSHNKTLENIKRGNALDVDMIIEKPIIPEELIGHIKRFRERWMKV